MNLGKLYNNGIAFCLEIKQDFNDIFFNDVDDRIESLAVMKFWAMTCVFGGGWFLWTATDLIREASVQVFDIAIVSSWVAIGILLIVTGHDVFKIAKNRQYNEKHSTTIKEIVGVGYLREKNDKTFSPSSELEKSADEAYKSYKKIVVKETWFPWPSLWNKLFPIK